MTVPDRTSVYVDAMAVKVGGGGTVVASLLAALADRNDVKLTVLTGGDLIGDLSTGDHARVVRLPVLPLLLRILVEQLWVPWHARNADVLLAPANFAIALAPVPQVLLVQNAHHFGYDARALRRSMMRAPLAARLRIEAAAARFSVRRARRTVAVSPWLAQTVREDCPKAVVYVVANATPALPTVRPSKCRTPYVLCVAHDQVHKDWDSVAETFERHIDLPRLVIAGRPRSVKRLQSLRARFRRTAFLGEVADRRRLASLYADASCCLVHSYLESSSLTPLEALAVGVPVAASDIPVHRTLSGDAVALYEPGDCEGLASAVRAALVKGRGISTLPSRSWIEAADELMAVLHSAAGAN